MKKLLKISVSLIITVILCTSLFVFSTYAAGSTTIAFSNKTLKVGDSVTVTVKLNAGESIYSIDGSISFNSSVLKYVSGASSASGSTLRLVDSFAGENSVSYSIVFNAIAEGTSNIAFSAKYVGASLSMTSASSSSANITVKNSATTTSKPTSSNKPTTSTVYKKSNNANLTAITVGGVTLSPEFSKNVTEYSVIVENSTEKVTISATKESSKATVVGTGEVSLQVGENPFNITVTAEDGTKKVYTLKIKRATIEESLAQNALATVIGGKLHHIVADLSTVTVPAGFSVATSSYNGKEINVLKSDDGSMVLYQISRDEDGYVDFYRYVDYRDEFVKINYITVNNTMYILPELPEKYTVPDDYYEATTVLGGTEVVAFCSKNEALKDFYIIYCFANGEYGFYRFDTLQTSIQRAPEFSLEEAKTAGTLLDKLLSLNGTERILLLALLVAIIIILVLAILLICGVGRKKVSSRVYDSPITEEDLNDFFKVKTKSNNN